MGVQVAHASSHHPQSDGQSERTIQTFLRLLRTFSCEFPATWEEKLPLLQFAINDAYCATTKSTPFRVLFGRDPTPPVMSLREEQNSPNIERVEDSSRLEYVNQRHHDLQEVWEFIRRHQEEVAERMKAREDRHRRDYQCQIGDLVLVSHKLHPALRNSRKQAERFYGPYLVHELRGPNAVELKGMPSRVPEVVNISFIKPYFVSPAKFSARPQDDEAIPITDGEEPEWEVEAILDTRLTRRGRRKFLIK